MPGEYPTTQAHADDATPVNILAPRQIRNLRIPHLSSFANIQFVTFLQHCDWSQARNVFDFSTYDFKRIAVSPTLVSQGECLFLRTCHF